MNSFLLLHPIGQLLAIFSGFLSLGTAYQKNSVNKSVHINLGATYYFLSLIGAVTGFIVCRFFTSSSFLYPVLHGLSAILIMTAFSVGAFTGFKMVRGNKRSSILKYHKIANILSLVVFISQAIIAIFWFRNGM